MTHDARVLAALISLVFSNAAHCATAHITIDARNGTPSFVGSHPAGWVVGAGSAVGKVVIRLPSGAKIKFVNANCAGLGDGDGRQCIAALTVGINDPTITISTFNPINATGEPQSLHHDYITFPTPAMVYASVDY